MKGCRCLKVFAVLLFSIFLLGGLATMVHAFGIATPFFQNDTVMLEPGQSFDYTIKVQNNDDISFDVLIEYRSDDDVAFLNSTDFWIPAKSYDNEFTFIISIPNISSPGSKYALSYLARPIMNITGQVPMNIEIRKSAYFVVVDENGAGYYANAGRPNKTFIAFMRIVKASYIYVVAAVVIAAIVFVLIRLWKLSSRIAHKSEKAPYAISEAKSVEELGVLLKLMNDAQFNNEFVRNTYSERFKELNENFMSRKALHATRREMLEALR